MRRMALLFLLGRKIKRIALCAAHLRRFLCLSFRHVARIDGDHAGALLVRRPHDSVGMAFIHPEDRLKDQNDEFARGVVVIEQNYLPQRRPLRLCFHLGPRFLEGLLAHVVSSLAGIPSHLCILPPTQSAFHCFRIRWKIRRNAARQYRGRLCYAEGSATCSCRVRPSSSMSLRGPIASREGSDLVDSPGARRPTPSRAGQSSPAVASDRSFPGSVGGRCCSLICRLACRRPTLTRMQKCQSKPSKAQ